MLAGQRVYFQERQRLTARDLEEEQTYLLDLDSRHNHLLHGPGIVVGLRIATDLSGTLVVEPGVAIDALGREVLLPSAAPIPDPDQYGALDVWLVYCREPVSARDPGRTACGPEAFARWIETGHVITTAVAVDAPPVTPDAAAVYLGRVPHDPLRVPDYTTLRAAHVKDPAGRTRMDVGPVTLRDRNGFTVVVKDGSGSLVTRLALDRQGNNQIYGVVNLLDTRAAAAVAAADAQALIVVQAKSPGQKGERIRLNVEPAPPTAYAVPTLRVLSDIPGLNGGTLPLLRDIGKLREAVAEFNRRSGAVTLNVLEASPSSESSVEAAVVDLGPSGGTLDLAAWPQRQQTAVVVRGCSPPARRRDEPGVEPNGLSFRPLAAPLTGTPLPGVHLDAVTVGNRAVHELRLDLGEKKDGDGTVRLAIGEPNAVSGDPWLPWLTVSGKKLLTLVGRGIADVNTPPTSVIVTGTIEQMPVKADLTDPTFRSLLVSYWLAGLQSSVQATSVVQVALQNLPTLIETDKPWNYDVQLTNQGSEDVTADTLVETRLIAGTTLLHSVASHITVPHNNSSTIPISHPGNEMPEGDLSIEVRITGKIGNFPWWNSVATTQTIPVVETPDMLLADLPATAPPGADFSYQFSIKNTSARTLTVTGASVKEGPNTQQLMTARQVLTSGQSARFGPIAHNGGISADLAVQITADYQWANGPAEQVIASKQIVSKKDLEFEFPNPLPSITHGQAWTYDLKVKNAGTEPVLLDSLRQRMMRGTTQVGTPVDIPAAEDLAILPGQTVTIPNIQGIVVPTTGAPVRIQVRPTYQRDSTTWQPQFESSQGITVQ